MGSRFLHQVGAPTITDGNITKTIQKGVKAIGQTFGVWRPRTTSHSIRAGGLHGHDAQQGGPANHPGYWPLVCALSEQLFQFDHVQSRKCNVASLYLLSTGFTGSLVLTLKRMLIARSLPWLHQCRKGTGTSIILPNNHLPPVDSLVDWSSDVAFPLFASFRLDRGQRVRI